MSKPLWHLPNERPADGTVVWILVCHPKRIYPQSYSIHAGTVVSAGPDLWRVEQGDESGCGWCSWNSDPYLGSGDGHFEAWAHVEDFSPAADSC